VVGVSLEHARQMVVIQPGLLFETQRGAETLAAGIRSICYELKVGPRGCRLAAMPCPGRTAHSLHSMRPARRPTAPPTPAAAQAEKEEVVRLILENQSVLHGRQMHLSVADIAHLAMMREPTGRIVD
jgi:hypothetical protein